MKDKYSTYRALEGKHVMTFTEDSTSNRANNARWRNRMCDLCFQRATLLIKGRLYCKDHAPTEPGGAA